MRVPYISLVLGILQISHVWAQKPIKSPYTVVKTPYFESVLDTLSEQASWDRLEYLLKTVSNTASVMYIIVKKHIDEGQLDTIPSQIVSISKLSKNPYKPLCWSMYFAQKGRLDLAVQALDTVVHLPIADTLCKGRILTQYAIANWALGNKEVALEHIQDALSLYQKKMGKESLESAGSFNNKGLIHGISDAKQALENYIEAEKIYLKYNNTKSHKALAFTWTNQALIYMHESPVNLDKALDLWDKVLQMQLKLFGSKSPTVAFTRLNIAHVFLKRSSFTKAIEQIQLAEPIYLNTYGKIHPEMASLHMQKAQIYIAQDNWKKALIATQDALRANQLSGLNSATFAHTSDVLKPDLMVSILLLYAKLLETKYTEKSLKAKDAKLALTCYIKADSLLDEIRKSRTSKADKVALGDLSTQVYDNAIALCKILDKVSPLSARYKNMAFYFNEKNKAAVLQESIAEMKAKKFAGIPDSILEKETKLKADIVFYEQKYIENLQNDKLKNLYKTSWIDAKNRHIDLIKKLEKMYPSYFNLKYKKPLISVKDIQKVLQKDEAMVSYFKHESDPYWTQFIITKRRLKWKENAQDSAIYKKVKALRNSLIYQNEDGEAIYAPTIAKQLNLHTLPKKIRKITIVPDGPISTIPIDALFTKPLHKRYWNTRWSITYSFSAGNFVDARKSIQSNKHTENEVLLLAPVQFGTKNALPTLPGTVEEVNHLKKHCESNGIRVRSLLFEKANESALKNESLSQFSWIHFATHGMVDEVRPDLSRIYLHGSNTKNEDGILYASEVYNLNMSADLVVLSACQTGLGKIYKGEGMIGLTRAFAYAGVRNSLVSLWTVSDASTAILMEQFYKHLVSGSTPAIALQLAKSYLRTQTEYKAPYYWAPFILVGAD